MFPATFHPAVAGWFRSAFGAPTSVQLRLGTRSARARNADRRAHRLGQDARGFLGVIDRLVRQAADGALIDETQVPLRLAAEGALERHPEEPAGAARGHPRERSRMGFAQLADPRRGAHRRHAAERARARWSKRRRTSSSRRRSRSTSCSRRSGPATCCARVRTVIVDEIHALARRQARRAPRALARAARRALRARPLHAHRPLGDAESRSSDIARFLVGGTRERRTATIVDAGHARERDLALELPASPLEAVMSNEVWTEVYDRLAELIRAHRTTLVFVEHAAARRARRAASRRAARRGRTSRRTTAASPREQRLDAEQRLKAGELKALVATASLELGIDIGDVDLVVPARLAARDRGVPAARRPLGPRARRHAEGAAVPAHRATSWSSARRCSTPCGAASSTAIGCPTRRSTCSRSRSSRRSPRAEWTRGRAVRSSCARAAPYRDLDARGVRRGRRDARARASRRGAAGAARICITIASTAAAGRARRAAGRDHQRRRDPGSVRLRRRARAGGACRSARSTKTSRSRAWRATSSSSATRRGASQQSSRARCWSRTRTARRRRFRSGSARRPAARDELSRRGVASCASQIASARAASAARSARRLARRRELGLGRRRPQQIVEYLARGARPRSARCRRSERWSSSASSTRPAACSS